MRFDSRSLHAFLIHFLSFLFSFIQISYFKIIRVLPFVLGLLSVSIRQQSQELQNGGNVNDLDKIVSKSDGARCLKESRYFM